MGFKIQRPDIWSGLQRLFRFTGRGALEFEPFIISTVQVADLSLGSQPPVRRSAAARMDQAAVALESAVVRFEMPGSGLMHIRSLTVNAVAAGGPVLAFFGSSIAVPANTADKSFTDGRLLQAGELAGGVMTFGTQVAALGTIHWSRSLNADTPVVFHPNNWIVGSGLPGQFGFLELQLLGPNVRFQCSAEWDEYSIV